MRYLLLFTIIVTLVWAMGCSDEQKEDAARLEAEMMELEGLKDSAPEVIDSAVVDDTVTPAMDAGAIPEKETTVIPSGPSGSGWAVQVASCEESDYAEYLVNKYITRGFEAYMTRFNHEGQNYFRVRLGPYETEAEARDKKAEVFDRYSVEAWIEREM